MSQDLTNKVYMEAMKLKNSSLSRLEMIEQLTLKGFPQDITENAVDDVLLERANDGKKRATNLITLGVALVCIGVLIFVASLLFLETTLLLPIGFLGPGVIILLYGIWARGR